MQNFQRKIVISGRELKENEYRESDAIYIDCGFGADTANTPILNLYWKEEEEGEEKSLKIDRYPFSIGRKSDENDYAILQKGVSRKHIHFELYEGNVYVFDDESTNGVKLNGKKIPINRGVLISSGDKLKMAEITFDIQIDKS